MDRASHTQPPDPPTFRTEPELLPVRACPEQGVWEPWLPPSSASSTPPHSEELWGVCRGSGKCGRPPSEKCSLTGETQTLPRRSSQSDGGDSSELKTPV